MSDESQETEAYSPRAFLQSRRPERFSDSVLAEERTLDRQLLEYHLDTLTSRSQETDFERFARKIAEREICPNLLPQTGPTGGGDSKVDSETFPVAETLALAWFVGNGDQAARERWAFAFSAKKKWRPKVRSDIAKIAGTGRHYKKAFFVTNQFVPDRKRAELEDELSQTHGFDVRILDRTWILERVFASGHEDLAESELGLRMQQDRLLQLGPRDAERERELSEIEARIVSAIQEEKLNAALVDDAIYAAELARALDRPRHEVEGRFARADRLALLHGTLRQRVEVAYQEAWTAFWWFEDEAALSTLYSKVEERAVGSRNAYDLERLGNLWNLLHGSTRRDRLSKDVSNLQKRTETLVAELKRLKGENGRPSTILKAEASLLRIRLAERYSNGESLGPVLEGLRDVISQARGLSGFPLDPLVQIIVELGGALGDQPEYEVLFEAAVQASAELKDDVTTAKFLVERGRQHLDAGRPRDAIRVLGRTFAKLYHHESRDQAVYALHLCGIAYEQIGLLWAARGALVTAASLATDELWRYGTVTRFQAACFRSLKWIELQLGRLPHTLAWHANDIAVRSALIDHGHDPEDMFEGDEVFDASLGVLLLQTNLWDLRSLSRLPDGLDHLGLHCAGLSLLYALGHEEEFDLDGSAAEREKFFLQLSRQPIAKDLPATPELWGERFVTFVSRLFGCKVNVKARNASPCVELAESVLAAIESFVGSLSVDEAVSTIPDLEIDIRISDFAERPFSFERTEVAGRFVFEVRTRPHSPHSLPTDDQHTLKEKIFELAAMIVACVVRFQEPESILERLVIEEEVFHRAIDFSSSFVAVGNVLGHEPPLRIPAWERGKVYSLKRLRLWNAELDVAPETSREFDLGEGEPEDGLDLNAIRHSEMKTVSLIREALWDRAGWTGVGYIHDELGVRPPIVAPLFKNREAGREIFECWLDELGRFDEGNLLRVVIIRGVNKDHPHWYRFLMGADPYSPYEDDAVRFSMIVDRIHLMEPESSFNLERFIDDYERHGAYILAPGFVTDDLQLTGLDTSVGLRKRDIVIRDAWEIGRNDPDCVAISPSEMPIIPDGVEDAPVLETIEWRRSQQPQPTSPKLRKVKGSMRNQPCPCGSGKKFKRCHGKS